MDLSCYLCGKNNFSLVREMVRHSIRRKVFRCLHCGLVFLGPKKKSLGDFYNKEYRKLYTPVLNKACSSEEIFNIYLPYQNERIARFKHLLNKKNRILEIGCSAGHFLYAAKKYVKECIGIEVNAENADFARKKCRVKIFSRPLEEAGLPKEHFDAIFLFETLEHLEDPVGILRMAAEYLKPGGSICVQVPNVNDVLLSVYKIKGYEDFYYREPHIFYFSPLSIGRLMRKAGFKGRIIMSQEYSSLNHFHWRFSGKPMASVSEGTGVPRLIADMGIDRRIRNELNLWLVSADRQYKKILLKYKISQSISFIGKKADFLQKDNAR